MQKPELSIIIPAYNEEDFIAPTLKHLQSACEACDIETEIIVVDNNSNDRTAEIAKANKAKVVFEKVQQIAKARNSGAAQAESDMFLFLDADTEINTPLLQETLKQLKTGDCLAGGTTLQTDREHSCLNRFVKYWNIISTKLKLAAGCYIFCQRDAFFEAGGFNEKVYASEEIWLFKKLKKIAQRERKKIIIIETSPIMTSARKFDWFSPYLFLLQILLFFFFPFLCRYKFFCFLWYIRPKKST
jgi:glycosyltransferase involved in cell wall biosynthesis